MNIKLWTASLVSGIALIYGATKLNSSQLTLLVLGAIPSTVVAHIVASNRIAKIENERNKEFLTLEYDFSEVKKLQKATESNLNKTILNEGLLKSELFKLKKEYNTLVTRAKNLTEQLNNQLSLYRSELEKKNIQLNEVLGQLNINDTENSELKTQIELLQEEIVLWQESFNNKLTVETKSAVDKVKMTLISQLFTEFKSIGERHESGIAELRQWTEVVSQRLADKTTVMLNVTDNYVDNLDALNRQKLEELTIANERIDSFIKQIRLLEIQLAGDLVEPQYGDFGFDINGKISNSIAYDIWQAYKIPLIVNGFDESEESVLVGYGFSKSLNIQSFLHLLERENKNISTRLGLFQIYDVKSEKTSPTITLKFRRERPKPLNDDEIYKLGLIPSSQFGDRIFIHTDHKTKGKPTLRIMSATGGGKGIATKNIVAYFLTQNDWEVWLSDPLHGSEEDYWNCSKVATSPSESAKAYSLFVKVHKDRQAKRPAITDKFVLGIFDEFDKQHDDDDKKTATEIMTAIRHTKQRQILIGQSGEVGANHWTWDAMKNCSLLFIEDAIGTAIKHDKDLGWSLAKKREIQRKYDKFTEWATAKNESQNLSSENAYRIGLIIVGDRYEFLEIPSAHKGILRNGAGIIRESFVQLEPVKDEIKKPIEQSEIECTHCQSTSFVRHKAHKNSTLHNYKCKSCNRLFIAKNNRIS